MSFVGLFTCGYSQVDVNSEVSKTVETLADSSEIYTVVDENPQFPGGDKARFDFLAKNIKFPLNNEGKSGTVYVQFVIEKDGTITNIKILRGVIQAYDDEVIRVVKLFSKWIPGKQGGKPVRVCYNMPVKFHTFY